MDLFQGSLAKKHFKKWLAFWRFYHEQNNRRLYLLYRRTRRLVQHWHHWAEVCAGYERRMRMEGEIGEMQYWVRMHVFAL